MNETAVRRCTDAPPERTGRRAWMPPDDEPTDGRGGGFRPGPKGGRKPAVERAASRRPGGPERMARDRRIVFGLRPQGGPCGERGRLDGGRKYRARAEPEPLSRDPVCIRGPVWPQRSVGAIPRCRPVDEGPDEGPLSAPIEGSGPLGRRRRSAAAASGWGLECGSWSGRGGGLLLVVPTGDRPQRSGPWVGGMVWGSVRLVNAPQSSL